jgi:hypothetical protein
MQFNEVEALLKEINVPETVNEEGSLYDCS